MLTSNRIPLIKKNKEKKKTKNNRSSRVHCPYTLAQSKRFYLPGLRDSSWCKCTYSFHLTAYLIIPVCILKILAFRLDQHACNHWTNTIILNWTVCTLIGIPVLDSFIVYRS